ncbi:MAG TPA: hypothetical protein VF121_04065 [Thermoanaerobaculia bacterium]|nr:hypothetical protein [Thermoanaerobaculia bacterium]
MRTYRLCLTIAALLLAAAPAAADGLNVTTREDHIRDCSDLEVTAHGRRVARAEESFTLPSPRGARLVVEGSRHGGVYVTGGAGRDYDVRVCKAAAASTQEGAERQLGRIRVESADGRLAGGGPGGGDWLVYFLIAAPRDAAMDVAVSNGPLAVRDTAGDFRLRAENGPIALRGTEGAYDVAVQNGPVSISGGGGDVKVRANNGPISVRLADGDWDGEGLDARAVNGPLSLSVGESFRSGVVVEASGNSPWSCSGCAAARRTWQDEGRRFELGEGPVRVRLSTVNGPVSIKVR